jgi:MFS family permease
MENRPNEKVVMSDHVEEFNVLDKAAKEDHLDPELQVKEALRDEADLNDVVVKKLIRKIDYRLIPPLAFLYAIALVDRNNLPNARLAGMDKELGISIGNRYTSLVMMFFIPYILFELPANLAMRNVGPAKWLGAIGFAWGIVTIGMGFVHSWGALLACRVFFGAFEAGLFPGSIYLMSCWYKRYEVQKRCVCALTLH